MKFTSYTHVGSREINEDSVGTINQDKKYCFVVADGLGGHGQGEVASSLVVEVVMREFMENYKLDNSTLIKKCIDIAQTKLMDLIEEKRAYNQLKTTIVVLIIEDGQAVYAHVGDSRCYHIRKNKYESMTLDHSVPQMLVASRRIKREEISFHPDRNRLLRVMGIEWNEPKYVVSKQIKLKENDYFLLCTDGFWEWISEKEILMMLKENPDPTICLEKIKEHVITVGIENNMDNNTAILVKWEN